MSAFSRSKRGLTFNASLDPDENDSEEDEEPISIPELYEKFYAKKNQTVLRRDSMDNIEEHRFEELMIISRKDLMYHHLAFVTFQLPLRIDYNPENPNPQNRFKIQLNMTLFAANLHRAGRADQEAYKYKMIGWAGINIKSEEDRAIFIQKLKVYNMVPIFFDAEWVTSLIDSCFVNMLNPFILDYINQNFSEIKYQENWIELKVMSKAFAQKILETNLPQNSHIVFIDHYMLLIPRELRKLLTKTGKRGKEQPSIGLYMNNMFPSHNILQLFPFSDEIVTSMMESNVITFQSFDHIVGFLETVRHRFRLNYNIEKGIIYLEWQVGEEKKLIIVRVGGILASYELVTENQKLDGYKRCMAMLKTQYREKLMVLAFDSLSPFDGIELKLNILREWVATLEETFPKDIVLIQIVNDSTPWVKFSSEATNRLKSLTDLFSKNQETKGFRAHLKLMSDLDNSELIAYLKRADFMFNTRLSSGVDPITIFYTLINDKNHALFSQFAALSRFVSNIIQFNPFDKGDVIRSLRKMLEIHLLSKKDKATPELRALISPPIRRKYKKKNIYLETFESKKWISNLVKDLNISKNKQNKSPMYMEMHHVEHNQEWVHLQTDLGKIKDLFSASNRILILLGYDGTLINNQFFSENPEDSCPVEKPQMFDVEMASSLKKLSGDNRILLYIMTSHGINSLSMRLLNDQNIGFITEKGFRFRLSKEGLNWESLCKVDLNWMKIAEKIMKAFELRVPGTYVINQQSSIIWYFDASLNDIILQHVNFLIIDRLNL